MKLSGSQDPCRLLQVPSCHCQPALKSRYMGMSFPPDIPYQRGSMQEISSTPARSVGPVPPARVTPPHYELANRKLLGTSSSYRPTSFFYLSTPLRSRQAAI